MIHVKVSTVVSHTEDLEKVTRAILSLFPGLAIEKKPSETTGKKTGKDAIETGNSSKEISPAFILSGEGKLDLLLPLHGLIRREEIIDSIRDKALSKGLSSDGLSVSFLLNKQAAFVGIPSIPVEEEPLGSIEVVITADSQQEMERLFEWLLPLTKDGKPVIEVEMDYLEKG